MPLYETIRKVEETRDIDLYLSVLHDDFIAVMHSSGKEMNRDEMSEMARRIFSSDKLSYQNTRCIYENDDLLVRHQIMTFGDDTKEAVMVVDMKKDGKIIRTETGATSLK